MASLFIKKPEVADLAEELAKLLGMTKTDAVHDALVHRKRQLTGRTRVDELRANLDAWRAANPLPPPTGKVADKAFFDSLWEDED